MQPFRAVITRSSRLCCRSAEVFRGRAWVGVSPALAHLGAMRSPLRGAAAAQGLSHCSGDTAQPAGRWRRYCGGGGAAARAELDRARAEVRWRVVPLFVASCHRLPSFGARSAHHDGFAHGRALTVHTQAYVRTCASTFRQGELLVRIPRGPDTGNKRRSSAELDTGGVAAIAESLRWTPGLRILNLRFELRRRANLTVRKGFWQSWIKALGSTLESREYPRASHIIFSNSGFNIAAI